MPTDNGNSQYENRLYSLLLLGALNAVLNNALVWLMVRYVTYTVVYSNGRMGILSVPFYSNIKKWDRLQVFDIYDPFVCE
jgi:hypothetical protein